MKISDCKLLPKILACFGLLAISVSSALWFATSRMKAIDTEYSAIISGDVDAMKAALIINIRLQNLTGDVWKIIAQTDPPDINKTVQQVARIITTLPTYFATAEKGV